MSLIIGIDNGISGGLCAMNQQGQIVELLTMPIQKARKGNEIDVLKIREWIYSDLPDQDITVILEEPGGSKSAKAASSMAGSFHAVRCLVMLLGYRFHRITPQSWQKVMTPGKGDTKAMALTKARELWPQVDFRASDRCKIAHDGLIDAALIAEYGRTFLLRDAV